MPVVANSFIHTRLINASAHNVIDISSILETLGKNSNQTSLLGVCKKFYDTHVHSYSIIWMHYIGGPAVRVSTEYLWQNKVYHANCPPNDSLITKIDPSPLYCVYF